MSIRLRYLIDEIEKNSKQITHALANNQLEQAYRLYKCLAEDLRQAAQIVPDPATQAHHQKQVVQAEQRAAELAMRINGTPLNPPATGTTQISPAGNFTIQPAAKSDITFADVAGLEDVKSEIRYTMIEPYQYPEIASKAGLQPGGGVLLYGPPGTGKTMIVRAIAGEVDAALFTIKTSDIMNKWVGESERFIAALFAQLEQYKRMIIFMDEIEVLMPQRSEIQSESTHRIIAQLLMELDGFEKKKERSLLFIGATNLPWQIDRAFLRSGRFHACCYVGLPDTAARIALAHQILDHRPIVTPPDTELAALTQGMSGADFKDAEHRIARILFDRLKLDSNAQLTAAEITKILVTQRRSVTPEQLQRFKQWSAQNERQLGMA